MSDQRYRALVCDASSNYYSETTSAVIASPNDDLNGTGSLTVTLPIDDDTIGDYQAVVREIAVLRDGLPAPFWRGPIVRSSASTTAPGHVDFQCANPLWYFSHRYFGSPIFPTNYLVNGSLEVWSGGLPVEWGNSGFPGPGPDAGSMTVTQLTTQTNPGLVMLGNSSAQLTCSTLNKDTFLNQIATGYQPNSEGLFFTLSAWFYIVPTMTAGPIGGRGLHMEFVNGTTVEAIATPFTITPNTPAGMWLPASVSLEMPAAGTSVPWGVDCRGYCPVGGSIVWDAFMLTIPESLSPQEPGGSDQSLILENIVLYAQGKDATGGVGFPTDNTKSNLFIDTACPPTGVLRPDLVYQLADRRGILDSLNDAPTWSPENDFAVVDSDAYDRAFTTFGRAVTDGTTTAGGNTFGSATAAFTTADCYQPLWHQNIPAGALIVPPVTSGTSVTFSGAGATASGSGLKVFIGGRRGTYRPETPLFIDGTASNLAKADPFDQDGEQMANSVVETTTSSANTGFVGAALRGVELGTLTSTLTASSTYTFLSVTPITSRVALGDLIRLGVTQWQPGVGEEGEVVIASMPSEIGFTVIQIESHTMGSTWASGAPVTDFTPLVTMEDVANSLLPAPIGQLTGMAYSEMASRQSAVQILTVTTQNDFIDTWCGGVPLVCGDVLDTTIKWATVSGGAGYIDIVTEPFRVISWTLNTNEDSYTLMMNAVVTT